MSQPHLLWVSSGVTKPDELNLETFKKWYDEVHIPHVLATKVISSATRYESIDPAARFPVLVLYPVKDAALLASPEILSIPTKDNFFPGPSHECHDFSDFDPRIYEPVHAYEKDGVTNRTATIIISAALTPKAGTDDDFNAWYREEHYQELAMCAGYLRTHRYILKTALKEGVNPPSYLAVHEFEGESLPEEDLKATGETQWGVKVMGQLVAQEIGIFKLYRTFSG